MKIYSCEKSKKAAFKVSLSEKVIDFLVQK